MKENNKKTGLSVRSVVATGIGAAVFFILMKYIAIPTVCQILMLTSLKAG